MANLTTAQKLSRIYSVARGVVKDPKMTQAQALSRLYSTARGIIPKQKKNKGGTVKRKAISKKK